MGEWNVRDQSERLPHEDHEIQSKTVHEEYNPATFQVSIEKANKKSETFNPIAFQNDIALLRLDKPVIYKTHIIPVGRSLKASEQTSYLSFFLHTDLSPHKFRTKTA